MIARAKSSLLRLALRARERPLIAALGIGLALALAAELAEGRPGGGNTYRGSGRSRSGGGSYGGGGGGDGGDLFLLVYYLFRLVFAVPQIGVPVLILVVLFFVLRRREGFRRQGWESAVQHHPAQARPVRGAPARKRLEGLRSRDPDFSFVLFEDFLQALFAEVHTLRGGNRLSRMAPYVDERTRTKLATSPVSAVRAVIVGSMKVSSVQESASEGGAPHVGVSVDFDANYTEEQGGKAQTYYVRERWTLHRAVTARSRPPGKTRTFECPNCGAPLDHMQGRTCGYCKEVVDTGAFDWVVRDVTVLEKEPRPPALAGDAPEVGTSDPTHVDPGATNQWEALVARDPAITWAAFTARVELAFNEMGGAWSRRDLAGARPFLTDPLLSTWAFWLEAYRAQGLWNQTEQGRITTVHLARVISDKYYDAVTVRLFASSLDFTLDQAGKVVAGSRSRPRDYSEYWTLIRSSQRKGPPVTGKQCPSCGAPLAIEMTGSCTYCRAKVTAGEFDWVLSRIEQDEAYDG